MCWTQRTRWSSGSIFSTLLTAQVTFFTEGHIPTVTRVTRAAVCRPKGSPRPLCHNTSFLMSLFYGIWSIISHCCSFPEMRRPRPHLSMVTEDIEVYLLWKRKRESNTCIKPRAAARDRAEELAGAGSHCGKPQVHNLEVLFKQNNATRQTRN